MQEQKAEFQLQDYTGSQWQSEVITRDGGKREKNTVGMEKEQLRTCNRASEAPEKFLARGGGHTNTHVAHSVLTAPWRLLAKYTDEGEQKTGSKQ